MFKPQAASLRYAGYQIAFVLSAFLAYTLLLWALGLIAVAFYIGFSYYSDLCWLIIASVLYVIHPAVNIGADSTQKGS